MKTLPFLWISLSLSAGILLRQLYIPSVIWPLLAVHLLLLFRIRASKFFWIFLCTGFLLLGMLLGNLDYFPAKSGIEREIQAGTFEASAVFMGEIISEPEVKLNGRKETASFIFRCRRFSKSERGRPAAFRSTDGNLQVFLNQPETLPIIGDQVRIWGQLEGLPPLLNPGGFDYGNYLKLRGVSGILNAYGSKSVKILHSADPFQPAVILSKIRNVIRIRLQKLFQEEDALLVRALILGDRKNFKGKLLDDFLKTGTSHLLAISGLNISLVAGSLYLVLIASGFGQKKAAAAAVITAGFQVAIAGFGIPVQRAGIMAGLTFLAVILERERSGMNIFFLAFLLLTAADTRALEGISFQLTFLSLFCLILFSHFWNRKWPWAEAWAASAAVLAGTFPVVIYHFNTFSPIGILVNILGIPLFHLILLTAFFSIGLGSIPVLGPAMIWICRKFIGLGLGWIHFCAHADWGYYFLPRPGWILTAIYYAALAGFLLYLKINHRRRWFFRGAFFSVWCAAAVCMFLTPRDNRFEMTVFSAGSNEIAHLQFGRDNQWLINTGRTVPGDQAQWIVSPYLRSKGIKNLKGVVFTDYLKRHSAGLETLERDFNFQYQVYPKPWKNDFVNGRGEKIYLGQGDKIMMPSGDQIEVLGNDRGELTLLIHAKSKKILFLPKPHFRIFQQMIKLKNREVDTVILFSKRDTDEKMLKALLTLMKPKKIILPRAKTQWQALFQERGIEMVDLSIAGAFQIRSVPGDGKINWQSQTFLK